MKSILYIFKGKYPWDVRVDKFTKSLISAGFRVIILSRWFPELKEIEESNNLIIIRTGYNLPTFLSLPVSNNPIWKSAIKKLITDFKPSLSIARDIMLAEATADISHRFNIPAIMDMAEHYPAAMRLWRKYNKTFARRLIVHKFRIPDLFERNSVRKMDGIITVCQEQNERLNHTYAYPEHKIQVVHNTPELEFTDNIRLGSSNPPLIFGHHGNMTAEKSIINFVKGFLFAADQNPHIKLLLAGAGEEFEDVKFIASNSFHKERVILTGEYNYTDLKNILSQIDVGVIPYEPNDFNNYTIHNKVFDFFAVGKPLIYSPCKPLIRLNQETNTGFVLNDTKPETISETILQIAQKDLTIQSKNSINSFKNKYNWNVDSSLLLNFIYNYI